MRYLFACPPKLLRQTLAALMACLSVFPAAAQSSPDAVAVAKLTGGLAPLAAGELPPLQPWVKQLSAGLLVRTIVTTRQGDPALLAALVKDVLALGGTVHYQYPSLSAIAVVLPAPRLLDLARSTNVVAIAPDRVVARTASLLQRTTGAADLPVRFASKFDGSGVGIAVLDSGIAWSHRNFSAPGLPGLPGPSRVRQVVDFAAQGKSFADDGWRLGGDESAAAAMLLDGMRFTTAQLNLQLPKVDRADAYGHGSHVASMAAGQGSYQNPDASGVATNAAIYDIRVLDDNGLGTTADVLAGIEWVIQHARQLNIRVMNLSLAADSTGSFVTDPLARAARSASHAGIVVVVAAGNAGLTDDGQQVYGTVGSPGHDPSVITVGAVNLHDSATRSGDTVTHFSSRGPTRGRTTIDGAAWTDNLVKPDLVAPGNARRARCRCARLAEQLELPGAHLPSTGAGAGRRTGTEPDTDAAQRHLGGSAGRRGRSRAAVAGQPGADAAAGQGDPAVHGAAAAWLEPARTGRGPAQHRRGGAARDGTAQRHRPGTCRRPDRHRRFDGGKGLQPASAAIDHRRPHLQLGPVGLRGRHPRVLGRRAVQQVPADL